MFLGGKVRLFTDDFPMGAPMSASMATTTEKANCSRILYQSTDSTIGSFAIRSNDVVR
jgi:hypothetical protein